MNDTITQYKHWKTEIEIGITLLKMIWTCSYSNFNDCIKCFSIIMQAPYIQSIGYMHFKAKVWSFILPFVIRWILYIKHILQDFHNEDCSRKMYQCQFDDHMCWEKWAWIFLVVFYLYSADRYIKTEYTKPLSISENIIHNDEYM